MMNTDKELVGWLTARMIDVNTAFKCPNLEDKLDALAVLLETTHRVMMVVEAQLAVSDKPYGAKYVPVWKLSTPPSGEGK